MQVDIAYRVWDDEFDVVSQSCLLGQGTFGVVVKSLDLRCNPPQEVAIKLLPRGDIVSSGQLTLALLVEGAALPTAIQFQPVIQVKSYKTYVKREIENQSRLRHPLIITIKEVRSATDTVLSASLAHVALI